MKKKRNTLILLIPFFVLGLLNFTYSYAQDSVSEKYFRHLRFNHVSPHVPIKGIHEINNEEANNDSHYVFRYNKANQLVEIVNNDYHQGRRHPLASIAAHKIVFEYTPELEIRTFFDIKGKRMMNVRKVYKEEYKYDKKGFKYALSFYNLDGKPMESNWGITSYKWVKNKNLIIEKRYSLENKHVDISPYFNFGITGMLYTKNGAPKTNYNLNEKLEVQENSDGVASYQDIYDKQGNHIEYSYHNANGELTKNKRGYAFARNEFDNKGYPITETRYDEHHKILTKRNLPSSAKIRKADPVSKKDTLEIREKSLGYLTALQELKPDLMKSVFHQDLAKRTPWFDRESKKEVIVETTYEQMVGFGETWNKSGTKFPPKPIKTVKILDIYNRIATVKLISDHWVEYLHLIKTNNQWHIINILWQYKNVNNYSR